MKQLTEEQAIEMFKGGEWKDWTSNEIVRFQLYQERLCMPFEVFHAAIETVLGHPIFTHEFADPDILKKEYENKCHQS